MPLHESAAGTILFLILYLLVAIWMVHGFISKRLPIKSRYAVVFLHVLIRLASQSLGIAFGVLVFRNINVFIAYLILGAEGYFTLVLITFRFLINWDRSYTQSRISFLEPNENPTAKEKRRETFNTIAVLPALWPPSARKHPMVPAESLMIVANAVIITGGSYLSGAVNPNSDLTQSQINERLTTAKALRTTGQSILFAINIFLGYCLLKSLRSQSANSKPRPHPTVILLSVAWSFLMIRGLYGVLQSCVWSLSYYSPRNYSSNGFTDRFSALQDSLGVATEWIACVCLNATSHMDTKYPPVDKSETAELASLNGSPAAKEATANPMTSLTRTPYNH